MKKNYNYWVTHQSTPQVKLKRILHILSSTCLVINLIIFAILLPDIRLWTLGLAFCFYYNINRLLFQVKYPAYAECEIIYFVNCEILLLRRNVKWNKSLTRPQAYFTWRSHISRTKCISQIPKGIYFVEKRRLQDTIERRSTWGVNKNTTFEL